MIQPNHSPQARLYRLFLLIISLDAVMARGARGGLYGYGIIGGPPAVTISFFVATAILFVGVFFGGYACYRFQQRKNWNRRVEEAEEAVFQKALCSRNKSDVDTFQSCTYSASYRERNGDDCTSKGTLEFKADPERKETVSKDGKSNSVATHCLAIVGHGTNQNGAFVVKRGKLDPSSGFCCWLEEAQAPPTSKGCCRRLQEPQQLLMTGTFSKKGGFQGGQWASFHEWGWVTDGKLQSLDLLSKTGSGFRNSK